MKLWIPIIVFISTTLGVSSQIEQHEVSVINVEVPVRVMHNNKLLDDLILEDFELYEDGKLQTIDALYLIKDYEIVRQTTNTETKIPTSRIFYMLFQLTKQNPRINEAIEHFFQTVFRPEDTLMVMTPVNQYSLSHRALLSRTKMSVAENLQQIIRKDTIQGAAEYNSILRDLKGIVRLLSGVGSMTGVETDSTSSAFSIELLLPRYMDALRRLEEIRRLSERTLTSFAQQLKAQRGQKVVCLFYQREYRPEIEARILNRLMALNQDRPEILSQLQDLFQMYQRKPDLDASKIANCFADSTAIFNLIFLDREPENVSGIYMREQSDDMFATFSLIADSTGGFVDTSQNPASGFENIINACAGYYILVYSPDNYINDGRFRRIKIHVKKQNISILHRSGYFAN